MLTLLIACAFRNNISPINVPRSLRQLPLPLPQRGGKRPGAGRKPAGDRAGVSHKARPHFEKPGVAHVTLRVAPHVWSLRSKRCYGAIERCLVAARGRLGLRVVHFSVLGNHLHLVVEAEGSRALSRGMQGLNIRVAKAVNRVMKASGGVFADHYHARLLATPTEVVNAIAYVLDNHLHHYGGKAGRDPFSSAGPGDPAALAAPTGWLLRWGWKHVRRAPRWLVGELERRARAG